METDELDKVIKAAELGDAHAQYSLGVKYENGFDVEKNYEEAIEWYSLASEQGYPNAKYNLGVMSRKGKGVSKNKGIPKTVKIEAKRNTLATKKKCATSDLELKSDNGEDVEQSKSKKIHMKPSYTTAPIYNKSEVDFDSWDAID
jgi:TPR repeat protein